jgi:multimeric flavodoxin WrbA
MKVILVSGSPRRGNTEWMINKLQEFLSSSGIESETVLLRRMDIKRCAGCLKCEDRKGICQLKDDMNDLNARIEKADALVLGTPVYFEMLSGLLKNFLDRTCPIWTKLEGKTLAGLAVAEEGIGAAIHNLKTYGKVCGMKWAGSVTVLAKNPGDLADNAEIINKLKRLAGKIVSST